MSTTLVPKTNRYFPAVFDEFLNGFNEWPLGNVPRKLTIPAVNVKETADAYEVSLAAPGLQKDDFRIDVEATTMTVSAEKEEYVKNDQENSFREEYNYSSFKRSFSVPEDVNAEKIAAVYKDGVLRLTLPRKEKVLNKTARQITVN